MSQPQPNVKPVVEVAPPPLPEGRKLASVTFNKAVSFAANMSVAVGVTCLSIQPARLEADGDCVVIEKGQRADGVLIRQSKGHPRPRVQRMFVPWSNIADLGYGE